MMEECFWKEGDHNAGRGMIQYINMYGGMGIATVPVEEPTNPETKKSFF